MDLFTTKVMSVLFCYVYWLILGVSQLTFAVK